MNRLSKFMVAGAPVFSLAGCGDSPMLRLCDTLVDPGFSDGFSSAYKCKLLIYILFNIYISFTARVNAHTV